MQKVLIVGTNSLIGANFLELSQNQIVREVSVISETPENIDFNDVSTVLHLSAIVHKSKKISDSEYFHVNRDLCKRTAVQAKAAGVKQFIFLSTVKVFGKYIPGNIAWNENSICIPEDSYGLSKYEAELSLKKLEDKDFTVSIIRTPIVYGKGVKANMLKLVQLVEKFPFLPFRNVNNNRHFTYIGNLVGFIDRITEIKASGTFIAMDDKGISTSELVSYLSIFLNRKTLLFKLPNFILKGGVYFIPEAFDPLYSSFYIDNSKTKEILNYTPPFSIEDGLKRMIDFYLQSKEENYSK
ncbi:MAG: NAD-dependent epimerase/dehydratase family protein [Bacteroidales bacterium]|nr:NAD-dependent epimerase/dehydratase family protein [Bacteroidales bacterium]